MIFNTLFDRKFANCGIELCSRRKFRRFLNALHSTYLRNFNILDESNLNQRISGDKN
jgi:hypothetical protein